MDQNIHQMEQKPFIQTESQINDDRYKTLFESVNAAAFLTSFNGQILEANQKSCELLGYPWEEILRLSLKNLLQEETNWEQFMDEMSAKGGLHVETQAMKKDGQYIPVDLTTSLFRLNGKPTIFVLIWDITQRKDQEKKLRESEKKYRGLFEYTTDGIIVLDARGDILDVNTKLCEMVDYTKPELIGKNLLNIDLLTPTSLPLVMSQFEQLLQSKNATHYSTEIKEKKGSIMTAEISSFFLVKKQNEVDNFVLSIRDITDRIKSEQNQYREHSLLLTLMNTLSDMIAFKDKNNQFVLVNTATIRQWNVDPKEIIGKTDFDFLPKKQAQQSFDDDTQVLRTGKPLFDKQQKIINADGLEQCFLVSKIPWHNQQGDIMGTLTLSRNVTRWEKQPISQKKTH